jgi:hypothetical protein
MSGRHLLPRHRRRSSRRLAAVLAAAATIAVVSTGVVTSQASWNDNEYVDGSVTASNCATTGVPMNTTSWARVLSGAVSGQSLDPVAALQGVTVSNAAPATSSSATGATATSLGSDAWSSNLSLSALNSLNIGAGVTLPFGTNTGAYTQWGRDTATGLSSAASGAVTSAAGGVASLGPPSTAPPQLADLTLSNLLTPVLGTGGITTTASQLSDVHLGVGAVGALATLDGCRSLWSGTAAALTRQYLLASLKLQLTSSVISNLNASLGTAVTGLETTLNGITGPSTSVTGSALTAVTNSLNSALNLNIAGVTVSLGKVNSLTVGATFDLSAVRALLGTTLSDGVVTVNLATGGLTVDLAPLVGAAYGTSGLNGLPPNSSLLTPAVLSAISARVGTLVTNFTTGPLQSAILAAVDAARVTVKLAAQLSIGTALLGTQVNALNLTTTVTGSLGDFAGTTGTAPVVSTTVVVGVIDLLGLISAALNVVLSGVVSAVATTVVPSITSNVVLPLVRTVALNAVTAAVGTLTGTTIPAAVLLLGGVLGTLARLVAVTANGQPDQAGSVGPPDTATAGRYFETALEVGVVNGTGASLAALYLANASVGPNTRR